MHIFQCVVVQQPTKNKEKKLHLSYLETENIWENKIYSGRSYVGIKVLSQFSNLNSPVSGKFAK